MKCRVMDICNRIPSLCNAPALRSVRPLSYCKCSTVVIAQRDARRRCEMAVGYEPRTRL